MLKTRTTATKEETRRAWSAQPVGLRRKAVPNVPRAVRGRTVLGVKIALLVMPEIAPTRMLPNAVNVHWAKQHRLKVPRRVKNVTPVDLAVVMVNVRHVQKVFTKTPKVKQNVRGVKLEKHTPMPKPNVVGVI